MSESVPVLSGVPQGPVLAPVLFLLFVNDVAAVVEVKIRLFADDCILYQRIDSCQDQLKKVEAWCQEWQMEINTEKTIAMSITKKKTQAKFSYSLGNVPLRNITVCKYLGILISSDLNWTAHVEHVTERLSASYFFLSEPFVIRHPKQNF